MKQASLPILVAWIASCMFVFAIAAEPATPKNKTAAFKFADVEYFHRWTGGDQHEFTPACQEDLDKWTDMVTIWQYPDVKDGEALAKLANTILEKYKAAGGQVFFTTSVPRTNASPAEHFISVGFTRPDFREAVTTRFKLHDGSGAAIIYSHRTYGQNPREKMEIGRFKNGLAPIDNLMKWNDMPKLDKLK